ncbi:hypothetical protein BDB00DRAFT_250860 [Zychaea mexicana]|uniref:uncharacterized protein n=1 Tax=Zychaea mexicana TaxID=64656 RepID=UPI0022FF347E|nr:uncharacterized protein BDB00DRAFT_250860 [Zychaea mexicana]KAI9470471.1 hypothetical protein BDB00DRAFT_250860 [Zychaea mexicana]
MTKMRSHSNDYITYSIKASCIEIMCWDLHDRKPRFLHSASAISSLSLSFLLSRLLNMPTTTIRIGYVPEHFSTPLYIARDRGFFGENDVSVELVCCPGGTGEVYTYAGGN